MSEQDETSRYEPYSRRKWRRERQGQPELYRMDYLPAPLLVQITQILERTLGEQVSISYVRPGPERVWAEIHDAVAHEAGLRSLAVYNTAQAPRHMFISYLVDSDEHFAENPNGILEQQLDAIEIAFKVIADIQDEVEWDEDYYMEEFEAELSLSDAIKEVNRRFRQHDIGYQIAGGQIVESDSEYTYAEIIEPAIDFLQGEGFEQPRAEFLRAHQHYRRGEMADAIIDANNAMESTMKIALERIGVQLAGNEPAATLIDRLTQQVLPAHLRGQLQALRTVMQTVSDLRNRAGVGHGAGAQDVLVLDSVAELCLNYAASTIKFVTAHTGEEEHPRP